MIIKLNFCCLEYGKYPPKRPRQRRTQNPPDESITTFLDPLKAFLAPMTVNDTESQTDSSYHFGMNVASYMRALPPRDALVFQSRVTQIMLESYDSQK